MNPVCTCGDTLGDVDPECPAHFPSRSRRVDAAKNISNQVLGAQPTPGLSLAERIADALLTNDETGCGGDVLAAYRHGAQVIARYRFDVVDRINKVLNGEVK